MAKTSTAGVVVLSSLFAAGCGGDGGDAPVTAELGTLAYVVSECRDTPEGFYELQRLRIRRGQGEPITVLETPEVGPVAGLSGLCEFLISFGRSGGVSIARQAFQRLQVSPDGSTVVFELTDEFSVEPPLPLELPPEKKGIFVVRADGSDLRRLGPPSRQPAFFIGDEPGAVFVAGDFAFRSDGKTVAYADRGSGPQGEDAPQIFLLDVSTGERMQLTVLPPGSPPPNGPSRAPSACCPGFVDDDTVAFLSFTNAGGLNPEGERSAFSVKLDGSQLTKVANPVALPGARVDLSFVITGDQPVTLVLSMPGEAVNPAPPTSSIQELFLLEGENLLQLTNFRRVDTQGVRRPFPSTTERIFFSASADPFGTNGGENCQIFSMDRLGGDLQQLTHFGAGVQSRWGCFWYRPPGCTAIVFAIDARSGGLIFDSNCDPLGTNPFGGQVFAMRPDGSGMQQLTQASGLVHNPDGTVFGQLPGPVAYGPQG